MVRWSRSFSAKGGSATGGSFFKEPKGSIPKLHMLKFYNTLLRKKQIFKSLHKGEVRMYNCGPTVYDFAHIGNFRAYIMADTIRRYLEYKGYKVKQVMNITDVGHLTRYDVKAAKDKIIEAAKKEKKTPKEIARFYEKAFLEDTDKLNIKRAYKYPRPTEHLQDIIKLIQVLIKKDYAYEAKGTVFYDITRFKNYGKLSGNPLEALKAGARLEPHPDKRHPYDFFLWLKAPKEHLMKWPSPWGIGYPGWHIECSVMSMKYLGPTLDIHTGGEDNIFPHHENEIAQSEAYTNKKFVRYWIHCRHLLVEGKKMSKSLGNFYTLRDLEKKKYDPIDFRFLTLLSHYRSHMDFSEKALVQVSEGLERIREFLNKLKVKSQKLKAKAVKPVVKKLIEKTKKNFEKSMDNDLDTPKALASIFDLVKQGNKLLDKGKINKAEAKALHKLLMDFDKALGVIKAKKIAKISKAKEVKILGLIKERERARKAKDWKKADQIRNKLRKIGVEVKDTDKGPVWKVKS